MGEQDATVFVVDDDASQRVSLGRLIRSAGLKAEPCASAHEFLEKAALAGAGCVVLDVRMPGMSGPEAQAQMAERGIHLPVVFLTGYGDVPTSVGAMKRGAVDFLEKPVDGDLLVETIRQALQRQAAARGKEGQRREVLDRMASLSAREHDVLTQLLEGHLNKQIAAALGISIKTVKVHRGRVMKKMQVRFVAQLVHLCECARAGPAAA